MLVPQYLVPCSVVKHRGCFPDRFPYKSSYVVTRPVSTISTVYLMPLFFRQEAYGNYLPISYHRHFHSHQIWKTVRVIHGIARSNNEYYRVPLSFVSHSESQIKARPSYHSPASRFHISFCIPVARLPDKYHPNLHRIGSHLHLNIMF